MLYRVACELLAEYNYFGSIITSNPQWAIRESMRIRLESIKLFGF